MEGMKSGRERREVLEEMRGAGVEPDVVTYNTIMQGFVEDFDSSSALFTFTEMVQNHVIPDQYSLSTLFSALVRGLNRDFSLGYRKIIELFSVHVPVHRDHALLNHFVAGPILRALASCGSVAELDEFWCRCERVLARSRDGWPGSFLSSQMIGLHARARSSTAGWERLVELCSNASSGAGACAANVVCKNWQQRGFCHFGDGCPYKDSHVGLPSSSCGDRGGAGRCEGRLATPAVVRRSVVCNSWEQYGSCRFGDGCLYKDGHAIGGSSGGRGGGSSGGRGAGTARAAAAPEPSSPQRAAVVCNNWQRRGSCQHGDACRFKDGHR
jgi:pentatricopeptide repeat protein